MKRRIGVIYAMREEAGRFLPGTPPTIRHGGVEFWTKLGGDLVIAVGGIGKVNAAMATQAMIDVYDPGTIINAGICGSLDPGNVGKVYLINTLAQHDVDTSGVGDDIGFVSTVNRTWFESTALRRARKAISTTWKADDYREASIVTGDWFAVPGDRLEWVKDIFTPDLIDMEAAAVAQVCLRNEVDFLAVKAVSDTVAEGHESEYKNGVRIAVNALDFAVMDIIEHVRQEERGHE